ncbi:MAG: MlaD family protein [Verrucomicrobia bacterium]|nr:MlaD family protein [Verrucomicrobiota bacterium]
MSHSANQASKKNLWISFGIWLLPAAALALVLWMAYQSTTGNGETIEITFENGQGIIDGRTELQYRGVKIGQVVEAHLNEDLSQVVVAVQLNKAANPIAVEGSKFWIARPEIDLTGIRGLDTILSGVYIQVLPGDGPSSRTFNGLAKPPVIPGAEELSIVLKAKRAYSIQPGSPVFFRDVQVGQINAVAISEDGDLVQIEAGIQAHHSHLVRSNSRFWNAGGIDVKGNLLGLKIQADSLETIVRGGVAFAAPESDKAGPIAEPASNFILHERAEKSWLEWGGDLSLEEN